MRRRDVTSFRDKRRKGTSRLEEEFLSAAESARFRIGENKKEREEKKKREFRGRRHEIGSLIKGAERNRLLWIDSRLHFHRDNDRSSRMYLLLLLSLLFPPLPSVCPC